MYTLYSFYMYMYMYIHVHNTHCSFSPFSSCSSFTISFPYASVLYTYFPLLYSIMHISTYRPLKSVDAQLVDDSVVVYPICPPNKEKQNTDKRYAYLPTKINTQNVCVYTTVGVCMHSGENYAVHLAIVRRQILVQVCTRCENTAWTYIQVAYMYIYMYMYISVACA